jgi:hypothetical protein
VFVGGGPLRSENAGFPVLSYDLRMVNGHELVPLKRYLGNTVPMLCLVCMRAQRSSV